ncbi:MAG: DUF3017 domain-containing protein [Arachnia sp.]
MDDNPEVNPAATLPRNPWPLLASLAVLLVGVGFVVLGHWRRGAMIIAAAAAAAALLRLALPVRIAGLLVVRGRLFDVASYSFYSAVIAVLAVITPATG